MKRLLVIAVLLPLLVEAAAGASNDASTRLPIIGALAAHADTRHFDLAREHWVLALIAILVLLILVLAAAYAWRANRRLAREIHEGNRTRDQLQMFASAVDQTADAVMITDPAGAIEYVNPAFTHVTGYTVEEVRGQNARVLGSGRHDSAFYQRLWETILRGEVFR